MATLQHYLSRCILRNFITEDNETFFVYDCASQTFVQKNLNKLFANYRSWSEKFEKILDQKFENLLGPVLKKYVSYQFKKNYIIGRKSIEIPQFSAMQIQDESDRRIISKMFYQNILMQQQNLSEEKKTPESILNAIFEGNEPSLQYPLLLETQSDTTKAPYILVDGIIFYFLAPDKNISKLGHLCFACPISPSRLILWGDERDFNFYISKYWNINYFNLCCIEQQGKKCKIASQNREYIKWISERVESFKSGEKVVIRASRNGEN